MNSAPENLPIFSVLPDILRALAENVPLVISASPGAGKSTGVPLPLIEAGWSADKRIVLLQPRRVAVRSLAHRLADLHGSQIGDLVGYQMRDETRVSGATRLIVMTEGVLRRRLLASPDVPDIAAILFDEFHERSLDADLCLALARDVRSALRSDLRIALMSATVDRSALGHALPDYRWIEAAGRSYPITTRYLPPGPNVRSAAHVARAVIRALAKAEKDILCFLPGIGDIRQVERQLGSSDLTDVVISPLYGSQTHQDQRAAIAPAPPGQRRVILATNIAETSLTLPNVDAVVDLGLERRPQFDAALGLTQLRTVPAAMDSLDQRRGRAGRVGPGLCYRLWAQAEMRARPASAPPDILSQDLAGLVLTVADWGADILEDLSWIDPPPVAALEMAKDKLTGAGLLDAAGQITALGRRAVQLPLPPDLAAFLLSLEGRDDLGQAALLCALLTDGGRAGQDGAADLHHRVSQVATGQDAASKQLRRRAATILKSAQLTGHFEGLVDRDGLGLALVRVRPGLLGQARGPRGTFRLASGRSAAVGEASALASAAYIVVGDALLSGSDVRILSGWPLSKASVQNELADLAEPEQSVDLEAGCLRTRQRIGRLVLSERIEPLAPGLKLGQALLSMVLKEGLDTLAWPDHFVRLQQRLSFARSFDPALPDLSFDTLSENADTWLLPLFETVTALKQVKPDALVQAATMRLDYTARKRLDALAPTTLETPAGSMVRIDYSDPQQPFAAAKLQAFFGLARHPMIADGHHALSLHLLSPAGRPLQMTRDLPGFWQGSYGDVRKDMRGRYPKHPWPENPLEAQASLKTKARGG